eukprot:2380834-Rhodomonas_salina.1
MPHQPAVLPAPPVVRLPRCPALESSLCTPVTPHPLVLGCRRIECWVVCRSDPDHIVAFPGARVHIQLVHQVVFALRGDRRQMPALRLALQLRTLPCRGLLPRNKEALVRPGLVPSSDLVARKVLRRKRFGLG